MILENLCAIEAYAPTDNVSELTARTNDEGWETVFSEWLKISHLNKNDGVLVFSVGGGIRKKNVSVNLINALDHAKSVGATILGLLDETVAIPQKLQMLLLSFRQLMLV